VQKLFSKAFVINLPFKADRLEASRRTFRKSLAISRFGGQFTVISCDTRTGGRLDPVRGAANRSHLQIPETVIKQFEETFFEDDAIFRKL